MANLPRPGPTSVVIFGAGGDLTWRKLMPALFNLALDDWLPEHCAIVGVDLRPMSDDAFRRHVREGIDQFSRRGRSRDQDWKPFGQRISYLAADFTKPESYAALRERIAAFDRSAGQPANHLYYMATSPKMFAVVAEQLQKAGLTEDCARCRLVIEKPFGHDLASARALNRTLTGILDESQIYRIDHYLGKETVQNILAFRFANSIYEPIWNRRYIDHVQITVAEQVGVEHRGGYYDHSGALRDMIQNHLMRVMTLVAMEAPVSFAADEVRNKEGDVLRALRPIPPTEVSRYAVRGQYDAGTINGSTVPRYRTEPDVNPQSWTETFAAIKLFVDNWRWQDVPFYLRTGKRLPARIAEVLIEFKPVPHRSFPDTAVKEWPPNRLAIHIQPDEGIVLQFQAKEPGTTLLLRPVDMRFSYQASFQTEAPDGYETLLLDALRGDATLFMRADQVETSWAALTPVLEHWAKEEPKDFPNYEAGTWGPLQANDLLACDGRRWLLPTCMETQAVQAKASTT
jgi:glucose-6-phosphate 1-dehydrogenase